MADNAVVGTLKTLLTMDSSSYESGAKKAVQTDQTLRNSFKQTGEEIKKITPLAERMVKSLGGDKLLYTANSLTAAVTKIGGASKLTEAEQARVNKTLDSAIAKYKQLGQEAPPAMIELEQATRKAASGNDQLDKSFVSALSSGKGFNAGLGVLVSTFGAYLSASAVLGAIKQTIEYADTLDKSATALGTTTSAMQRLENIAVSGNTTLDAMTNAIAMMADRLASGDTSALAALKQLGLTVDQVFALHPDQQFILIAKALQEIQSQEQRIRLGKDIFGRSAVEIMGALRGNVDQAAESIRVMSETNTGLLADLAQAWDRAYLAAKRYVGFSLTQASNPLGAMALFPDLPREPNWRGALPSLPPAFDQVGRDVMAEDLIRKTDQLKQKLEQAAEAARIFHDKFSGAAALSDAKKYEAELKAIGGSTKLTREEQEEFAKVFQLVIDKYRLMGPDGAAIVKHFEDLHAAVQPALTVLLNFNAGLSGMPPLVEAASASIEARLLPSFDNILEHAKAAKEAADKLTNLGMITPNFGIESQGVSADVADEMIRRRAERYRELALAWRELLSPLVGGAIRGAGNLLFGAGDAREAKQHYEDLKKSGRATAEELTRAFQAWRQAERHAWQEFTNAIKNMVNNLFNHIVNKLMGGLVDAALGTKWGQALGGGLARVLGIGGTVAATAGTAAAATAAGTSVGATAVATGAGGAGLGATLAGLATNPITIGAAVAIAGGLLLKKLGFFDNSPGDLSRSIASRALLKKGVPISQFPKWITDDQSTMERLARGDFAPKSLTMPDISMPSQIALPGSGLASQTPFAQTEASARFGRTVHVNVNVSTIDAKGVRDFVRSREFGNAFAFSMEQNDQQRTSRTRRAFNP